MRRLLGRLGRGLLVLVGLLMVLVVALTVAGLTYHPSKGVAPGYRGELMRVGALDLRVYQAGQGADVVLVHGQGGSMEDFGPLLNSLAKKYRVTAYDRPGHGFSDPGHELQDLQSNAVVLEELVAKLRLAQPILVGHSYGGGVALAAASRGIIDAKGLVLIGSVGYPCGQVPCRPRDALERMNRVLFPIPGLGTGLARVVASTFGRDLVASYVAEMFSPAPVPPEYLEHSMPLINSPKSIVSNYEQEATFETSAAALSVAYPQIRKPVVILQGQADFFTELPENARRLHATLPTREIVLIDGAGHMLPFTHPQAILDAVDRLAAK